MIRVMLMAALFAGSVFGQGLPDGMMSAPYVAAWARAARGVDGDPLWDGLVAYYPLNGTAYDEVTGTTGTWGAGVTETTNAISGTAASLDKTVNSYITTVGGTNLINGATAFSVSMWVNQQLSWANYSGFVASYGGFSGSSFAFQGGNNPRQLRFTFGGDPGTHETSGLLWDYQEWAHIGMSVSVGQPARFYVNGFVVVTGSGNMSKPAEQFGEMFIGYDPVASSRKFGGFIDEVAIWNRVVTSNEFYRIATDQLTYP